MIMASESRVLNNLESGPNDNVVHFFWRRGPVEIWEEKWEEINWPYILENRNERDPKDFSHKFRINEGLLYLCYSWAVVSH
jgi:hypothetical protein